VNAAVQAMAALYAPSAAAQAKGLPDIADALHAQLCRLSADPTPEEAANVAANLGGAQRALLCLCEALKREQEVADGAGL
jgi:hypothetical protein